LIIKKKKIKGMNFICGVLLLLMDEEAAFWLLATIVEDYIPDYFNVNMTGTLVRLIFFRSNF
jgi:hypothetical protein